MSSLDNISLKITEVKTTIEDLVVVKIKSLELVDLVQSYYDSLNPAKKIVFLPKLMEIQHAQEHIRAWIGENVTPRQPHQKQAVLDCLINAEKV